jgi:hypothetical protein
MKWKRCLNERYITIFRHTLLNPIKTHADFYDFDFYAFTDNLTVSNTTDLCDFDIGE